MANVLVSGFGVIQLEFTHANGYTFAEDLEVRKGYPFPGWFIYGHNSAKYGTNPKTGKGSYVGAVAYRGHKRNGMPKGFATRREALAILPILERKASELRK